MVVLMFLEPICMHPRDRLLDTCTSSSTHPHTHPPSLPHHIHHLNQSKSQAASYAELSLSVEKVVTRRLAEAVGALDFKAMTDAIGDANTLKLPANSPALVEAIDCVNTKKDKAVEKLGKVGCNLHLREHVDQAEAVIAHVSYTLISIVSQPT